MSILDDVQGEDGVAKYGFEFKIAEADSKKTRRDTIRNMKENASFKGFRKGEIPPFIWSKIDQFVLEECFSKNLKSALDNEGLELLEGDLGKVNYVDRSEADLKREFQSGSPFSYKIEICLRKKA